MSIGYVLGQTDRKGREQVISYGGRALRAAEKNYYHIYLAVRKFKVFTDHQALLHFQKIKETQNTGKLARWTMFLQGYDFEMVYKKGTSNGNADALSRRQNEPEPKILTAYKSTQTDTHFVDFNPAASICELRTTPKEKLVKDQSEDKDFKDI